MQCQCNTTYRPCRHCCRLFAVRPAHEKHRGTPQLYCSRPCWKADWPARFWAMVDKSADCWLWLGGTNESGYGLFQRDHRNPNHRQTTAHRVAYELTHGVCVLPTIVVCHTCDNPPCVRPQHLWLGTQSENLRDAYRKGRRLYTPPGSKLART